MFVLPRTSRATRSSDAETSSGSIDAIHNSALSRNQGPLEQKLFYRIVRYADPAYQQTTPRLRATHTRDCERERTSDKQRNSTRKPIIDSAELDAQYL